jgi:phosphoglycerate dehydrogenase-like enzyme
LRLLVTTGPLNAVIDVAAAKQLGIVVTGTGYSAPDTAELTWGLILAVQRNIAQEDAAVRSGRWQTTLGTVLSGSRLGILGIGNVGKQVARIGQAFNMDVVGWSQNLTPTQAAQAGVTYVDKEEFFRTSDVLSVHLVLSDRTLGIVGRPQLAIMKPSAILVNTSRGPIVDEVALVDALQRRTIAGAGLDVYGREPLPSGHPFLSLTNTVLTPHIGYVTSACYRVFFNDVVEDIAAFLAGNPTRVIN